MKTPTIEQGKCTACEHSNDNYSVEERTYHPHDNDKEEGEPTGITREVTCDNCGATATVNVDKDGTTVEGAITLEDASWNQDS